MGYVCIISIATRMATNIPVVLTGLLAITVGMRVVIDMTVTSKVGTSLVPEFIVALLVTDL